MKRKYSCMQDLLRLAQKEFDSFSLIFGCGPLESESTAQMREALHPFLLEESMTTKWPSQTIVGGSPRLIRFYRVCQESLKILAQVPSIFDFLGGRYPEDLIFYLNREPKLVSSAHSGWTYFEPWAQLRRTFRSEYIRRWDKNQ